MVSLKRTIFSACALSAGLLLAPQMASAAIYWQSGDDWVVGDAPAGATFTETNNGATSIRGNDRGKTGELLANSRFFSGSVTADINTAAISRQAPGSSAGTAHHDTGQWTADLGDIYTLNKIVLHNAGQNNNHGFFGFTALYSEDGVNWTQAGIVDTVAGSAGSGISRTVEFNDVQARYLRLSYGSTSGFSHYRLDRMDLYVIPEPASITLVGAAGVLLLGGRRRAGRLV